MYHASSSSSSSQGGSMASPSSGLTRYGSAPDSFLSTAVDSVMILGGGGGPTLHFSGPHRYFSSSADTTSSVVVTSSESTCQANSPSTTPDPNKGGTSSSINRLQRSYGFNEIAVGGDFATSGGGGGGSLVRHSSSPAGFLNHHHHHHHHHHLTPTTTTTTTTTTAAAAADNAGFPVTRRRIGSYDSKGVSDSSHGISRLNSQLSFTRQESLSHISEESENVADGISADNSRRKAAYSYVTGSFGMGSWDDTNAIVFSAPPSQRAKNVSGDVVHCLNTVESQFQFSLPQTAMEMPTMEKLLQIPQDSVPCKIGAKRGCATHPRSIAERERRTRISGKLKKLQELVPNMDKQTSYADMLDLAVHHIKGLQNQVQKLNNELEDCKCGCKQAT